MGEQKYIGAHHTGNGAASTNGRNRRMQIEEDVRYPRSYPTKEVEQQVTGVAKELFHVVTEDPKEEHVAEQVSRAIMQKHARQKGKQRCVRMTGALQ